MTEFLPQSLKNEHYYDEENRTKDKKGLFKKKKQKMTVRQPIVVLVGHIDHGKSSILERVSGCSITKTEPGLITQSIKSYNVPMKRIREICGAVGEKMMARLTIPGLLFLDSPGHAAFNSMRKRGGNLADMAIVVIDIREGVKDQTKESIEILKQYKTPFVIALNKIDTITGWHTYESKGLGDAIASQSSRVQEELDKKVYELVASLAKYNLNAERFDRVDDFTRQIAIVPVSAKTKEGLPELVMTILGLAQKFMEKKLEIKTTTPGRATILEVKEEKGLGTTLDVILYDGTIRVNDQIVIGTLGKPIVTKVRGLFEAETGTSKYSTIKKASAAASVKIAAPNTEQNVIGGMPIVVANKNVKEVAQEMQEEIEEVMMKTEKEGVVVKADTIGSLEAITGLLKNAGVPIKRVSIGDVSKKDIAEAKAEKDVMKRVILGFNVKKAEGQTEVHQICHDVVFKIVEEFDVWKKEQEKKRAAKEAEGLQRPCKIKILRGFIFRQSNPAVFGVHVELGVMMVNADIMKKDGSKVGVIKEIQEDGKNIQQAEIGKEVAISVPGITVGRQVREDDVLYSDINEEEFTRLKKFKKYLSSSELECLKEIAEMRRKQNPVWGM